MRIGRRGVAVTAVLVLAATATAASAKPARLRIGPEQWRAGVAALGVDPDQAIFPFATTPEMEAWAASVRDRYGRMSPTERLKQLQLLLFDAAEFPFSYNQTRTLTAAEAFTERRGNCMAFTVMFVALSRALGVDAFLVAVGRAPEVEKQGDLVVVTRHVVAGFAQAGVLHLYDFHVSSETPYVSRRVVDDIAASALFHTNLGGAAIREDDLEGARRHLELAIRLDPDQASAWVNLGVVRSRTGDLVGALAAYERALHAVPEQPSALTNMAYVYQRLGLEEEARAALRAAAEGRSSPFALIALADVELLRGNLKAARSYLSRARRTYRKVPEVYEASARLERRAGKEEAASRYDRRAEKVRRRAEEQRGETR